MDADYNPGDLIFAKVKGYPHWPARVSIQVEISDSNGYQPAFIYKVKQVEIAEMNT